MSAMTQEEWEYQEQRALKHRRRIAQLEAEVAALKAHIAQLEARGQDDQAQVATVAERVSSN